MSVNPKKLDELMKRNAERLGDTSGFDKPPPKPGSRDEKLLKESADRYEASRRARNG